MKTYLTTLLLLTGFLYSNAQIAISARYISNSSDAFESLMNTDADFRSGYEVGVGYWFRLQNKRMEFTPEISYASMNSNTIENSSINFNANILIYPLDFHSDCNACPTFSKDGGLVKKGFYWIISPGLIRLKHNNASILENERTQMTYRLGAGLGLDIGVTNLLTISPFAMFNLTGNAFRYDADQDGSLRQIHVGLRSTLRFDKNKW